MALVSDELSAELRKRGLTSKVKHSRMGFKAQGLPAAEALAEAVRIHCPDLVSMCPAVDSHRMGRYGASVPAAAGGAVRSGGVVLDVKPSDFAGKDASWGEVVDWVVRNLAFPPSEVDLKGAPDAKALAYIKACWESGGFASEFLLKMGQQRMPKRIEEEDRNGGPGGFDGKAEYDLLGAIAGGRGEG